MTGPRSYAHLDDEGELTLQDVSVKGLQTFHVVLVADKRICMVLEFGGTE